MTAKKKETFEETPEEELAKQEGRPRLVKAHPPEETPTEETELVAQRLPGMELPTPAKLTAKQAAQLTLVCQTYDKIKYRRVELTAEETAAKKTLDAYMNSVGLDSFVYPGPDGKVMECFIDNNPVVKTRVRQDEPALTEPGDDAGEAEDGKPDDAGDE